MKGSITISSHDLYRALAIAGLVPSPQGPMGTPPLLSTHISLEEVPGVFRKIELLWDVRASVGNDQKCVPHPEQETP